MSTTLPDIFPAGFAGDISDFLKTKVDRSGALRVYDGTVSVPGTTAQNKLVGLFPFNKGFKVHGMRFYSADLDTSTNVTVDIGYQYYDSATGTSHTDSLVSASTAPQASGFVTFTGTDVLNWTAAGDGWLVAKITGGATITTGSFTWNLAGAYEPTATPNTV